eukprot:109035-Ditylum_brightwellii.AAC.1
MQGHMKKNKKMRKDSSFVPQKTTFKVVFKAEYGLKDEREPTSGNLMHKYFPYYIIDAFVKSANKYVFKKKQREPNLKLLPSKRDYWSKHRLMPSHKHFHVQSDTKHYQDEDAKSEEEDEEKEFVELTLERVKREEHYKDEDDATDNGSESVENDGYITTNKEENDSD